MQTVARRIGTATFAVVAVVTFGVVQPAEARTATNGAFYQATDTCDRGTHTLQGELLVKPQPGWGSQYVAIRAYVRDATGAGQATAWTTVAASQYTSTVLVGGASYVGPGTSHIWHEFMWWNGTSWTADTGWVEDFYRSTWTYTDVSYGSVPDTACRT